MLKVRHSPLLVAIGVIAGCAATVATQPDSTPLPKSSNCASELSYQPNLIITYPAEDEGNGIVSQLTYSLVSNESFYLTVENCRDRTRTSAEEDTLHQLLDPQPNDSALYRKLKDLRASRTQITESSFGKAARALGFKPSSISQEFVREHGNLMTISCACSLFYP